MTQTYRKAFGRNTVRVSSDKECRFGTDYTIARWTLTERLNATLGNDPTDLDPAFITACAENGKGAVWEVTDNNNVTEFFATYKEARDFAFSQFC
jgi:hypothetical protein